MGRLYLTIAFVLAGSSVIAACFVSAYIPPFATTFLSLAIAALTAALLCGKKMYATAKCLSKRLWFIIVLEALLGSFLFRAFMTMGLQHISATQAGIITGATPAITALLTWIMLREHLNIRTVIGVLITFTGILLVQGFPFSTSLKNLQPLGAILVLCAAVCESPFTTLSRKMHMGPQEEESLSPLAHAGLVSIVAMLFCLVPALLEHRRASITKLPVSGWIALVWYGSIVTVAAFACMFAGAKRCNGYTIAAFAGIIPISSTVLSVAILKEATTVYQVSGCVLVVFATIIISRHKKVIPPPTAPTRY